MKYFVSVVILVLGFCSCKRHPQNDKFHMMVYSGHTMVKMEDFDRKVTGFDSIQLIIRNGKLEANFCYPNKWEFEKWKKDTIYVYPITDATQY